MCAIQFRVRHKLIFTELNKISAEIYLRYLMVCCSLIENLTSLVTVQTKKGFVANPRKSMGIAKHKLSRVGFNTQPRYPVLH